MPVHPRAHGKIGGGGLGSGKNAGRGKGCFRAQQGHGRASEEEPLVEATTKEELPLSTAL